MAASNAHGVFEGDERARQICRKAYVETTKALGSHGGSPSRCRIHRSAHSRSGRARFHPSQSRPLRSHEAKDRIEWRRGILPTLHPRLIQYRCLSPSYVPSALTKQ
jgi:hypothetical protein